ncbi:accessory gland protein Acp32CD [Drosophila montana]|uniref:accessory gland protein Acp32CD n=1 Tax=Drosophila montana TaxID=40370 RepID=UPI00313C8AF7
MRTRLSIRILALGLLLWQLQASAVLGQKYYMNFAFNNNNPDAEGGGGSGEPKVKPNRGGSEEGAASRAQSNENAGSGVRAESGSADDGKDRSNPGTDKSNDDASDKGENSGGGGGGGDGSAGSGGGGGDSRERHEGNKDKSAPLDQRVHDNDDSDSHDPIDRRQKEEQALAKAGNKEHSHHSSYEISIDDSFGGRYVRSIYESSESHGHEGARADSGRDNQENDSSASKAGNVQKEFGDQDYEEPIEN